MELYLNNCSKTAKAAATKVAASTLKAEKTCGTSSQKRNIPEVGVSHLLDMPLGVKLPVLPGSTNLFYTTNISETLYQPSFGFNLNDPYCRLLEPSYKSLHDPHLKTYYKRKDILKRLRKGGYITSNNKVICSLKELNKYRQYLTSLKIDFQKNYMREQKIIEKQVNELQENKKVYDNCDATHFQQWLLQESLRTTPDQDLLIKRRYLHMISRELDKIENATERRSALRMREEERRHQEHLRRRLNLHRQIEEEWKSKEMLLLTKIREEVKREAKVEEQHRKVREEIDQKNQALLEKKITYHLQKGQRNEYKISESEENILENKRQDEAESVRHFTNNNKVSVKKSTTLLSPEEAVQANTTEQKDDTETTITSYPLNDEEVKSAVVLAPVFSDKATSISRQSILDSSKQEQMLAIPVTVCQLAKEN
ncbi:fibrous sheath-interacting protein 2-like [Sciurus carolinensis]|uniref:fibrous sheath-interacting protein 2-like n=1 Tax=Sciurus carolinensis TaxID=30640 RepID=UPI001FB4DE47|nr:fibrous sheath-interacting protein 2-like [Sciurus carolinensis]